MIPVHVAKLSLSNMGFVVLLQGTQDSRTLPVFIGPAEAQAIAIRLDKMEVPRPLTHDLLKNILDCLEWRLKRVEVCDLADNTFYAKLILEHDGQETEIDSRPSDGIALALRCSAPIFVLEKVMDSAGIELPAEPQNDKTEPATDAPKPALTEIDALKVQLEKAIREERYEEAASLRDRIRKMELPHGKN